jgi:hypothetical protein
MTLTRSIVTGLAALALALLPTGARAELTPWDQEEVAKIAQELRVATKGLWETFRKDMPSSPGTGSRQAQQRLLDNFKKIENQSRKISMQLDDGKGREDTLNNYKRLMMLVRDSREEARRQLVLKPTLDKITTARDALFRLAPYYEADWTPPEPVIR